MLFPTIEFTIFTLLALPAFFISDLKNVRLFLLIIFNCVFYYYLNNALLLYLISFSFLLYFFGKHTKFKLFFIALSILQLSFWKAIDADIITFDNIATPIGVSFFTFQGLTYFFARIKLPKTKEEEHINNHWDFFHVFAFTGFFPTVFSGPILRAKKWREQLDNPTPLTNKNLNVALTYISLGLFYKLCLASVFNQYSSIAFSNPKEETLLNLIIGAYSYTFEIFNDFAGYSLMSIGIALLFGFSIPQNFNSPYLSINIKEFWQRWHISFSTWLQHYFYFSLGGSKVGKIKQLININIVMLVCGLWHGFTLNYLVWGGMHGIAISLYHLSKNKINPTVFTKTVFWFLTFNYIAFSWIFFRSPDLLTALDYIGELIAFDTKNMTITATHLFLFLLFCFSLFLQKIEPIILNKNNNFKFLNNVLLMVLFWSFIFIVILILSPSGMPPFIYFSY